MLSKIIGFSLLLTGAACFAFAGTISTPEIDGASAVSAVVLLSGGLLVLRARRKKIKPNWWYTRGNFNRRKELCRKS